MEAFAIPQNDMEFTVACFYGGIGGQALGFQKATGEWRGYKGHYRVLGSIDVNPARTEAFTRLTGVEGTTLDLFTRIDYIAFHSKFARLNCPKLIPLLERRRNRRRAKVNQDGMVRLGGHEGRIYWKYQGTWWRVTKPVLPSKDWREATPDDLLRIFGPIAPDIGMGSSPCQGFSPLLPAGVAEEPPHQALNNLTPRVLFLSMLAWPTQKVPIFLMENVPGIKKRGAKHLAEIKGTMGHPTHNYRLNMADHDCGEICGLAQKRPRWTGILAQNDLVAGCVSTPPKVGWRAVKDVIGPLPFPGDPKGGPLHKLPKWDFITALRAAATKPGGDHKDLPGPGEWRLMTLDGREVPPEAFDRKHSPDPAVWGRLFQLELLPSAKHYASLRLNHTPMGGGKGAYWNQDSTKPTVTVTGDPSVRKTGSPSIVTDLRLTLRDNRYRNQNSVADPHKPAKAVSGAEKITSGLPQVSDLRLSVRETDNRFSDKHTVADPNKPTKTVNGNDRIGSGFPQVSDLRVSYEARDNAGKAVNPDEPTTAVTGNTDASRSNGPGIVPDIRFTRQSHNGTGAVLDPNEPTNTVTPHTDFNGDAAGYPDLRMTCGAHGGTGGVVVWTGPGPAVIASIDYYAGQSVVEDQRMNAETAHVTIHWWPEWFPPYIIISPWNAWHRGFTPFELAVIQGIEPFDENGLPFYLEGTRKDVLQAIGNMVPPPAAQAWGEAILPTLIAARLAPGVWIPSPLGTKVWVKDPDPEQPQAIAQ